MVSRVSFRCVRTRSNSSSKRTLSSSVPKNDSICPEMCTVRLIQLEGFPATGTGWPMGFLQAIVTVDQSQEETSSTLSQPIDGVKLRSSYRLGPHSQFDGSKQGVVSAVCS